MESGIIPFIYRCERQPEFSAITISISTRKVDILNSVEFFQKLFTVWTFCEVGDKEILQNQLFPEGVFYDRKNGALRPKKISFIFELMARQLSNTDGNAKGTKHLYDDLSLFAEKEGFEPPTCYSRNLSSHN